MVKKKVTTKIVRSMTFTQLMNKYPEVVEHLLEKGMHCIGCPMSMQETIEQGAIAHGIDPKELVKELNKKIGNKK